ncbi:MAG: GDSL-type esterase/lipase family protein [Bacteroidota bacterium]
MMKSAQLGYVAAFIFLIQGVLVAQPNEDPDPERFEEDIAAFEQWDLKNSFPEDAILFVGSSSIRFWETHEAFPKYPIINRGFGGSHISDVQHYYEQTIGKYDPSVIVFYAGDNDVADDKPVSQVVGDYKELVNRVMDDFQDAKFVYVPIKPSASRWEYWQKMDEVNQQIKAFNKKNDRLYYVDLATPLLAENGEPDDSYYVEDQLHLSDAGYEVWDKIMSQELEHIFTGPLKNE